MPKLKWVRSYETLLFNTPDGDLSRGEFARFDGGFLVREHPKNNQQWVYKDRLDTTGLTEVTYTEKAAWYHSYRLSDGRMYRERKTDGGIRRMGGEPVREKTPAEETEIKKDDDLWR